MGAKTWVVWTTREERLLREAHASDRPLKELMHLFPNRTLKSVATRMNSMGLGTRPNLDRGSLNPSIKWQTISALLRSGEQLTTHEIAVKAQCTPSWVLALIKKARSGPEKLMHIVRWRRARTGDSICCWVEVWGWGDGPDAPKPRVPTHSEHVRQQRLRRLVRQGIQVASPFDIGARARRTA